MDKGNTHTRNFCGKFSRTVFLFSSSLILGCILLSGTGLASDIGLIMPYSLKQNAKSWVILDARPRSEWASGHIPGALSFSWEDYTRTDENGVPYRVWPPQLLASALGKMGIDENTPVVVYGDADKSWGGEGWDCWVLSWLGHKGPIRLLNGGIQAWRSNNFTITSGNDKRQPRSVRYEYAVHPQLDISTAELKKQKDHLTVIDTRSFLEWIRGHIPGAVHINWTDLYSGRDRRPLSPDEFKKLLREAGIETNRPMVYYCTGGIRSAYAWMVHQLSGLNTARNYEGGFEAWTRLSGN